MPNYIPVEEDPFAAGPSGGEHIFTPVEENPFGPPEEESYFSKLGAAAKVGLKGGLAGAMKMYEIPSRPILQHLMGYPGELFASESLKPTPEEEEKGARAGIPGEIVKGAAALPGAFVKYAPLMAAAPAGIVGTGLTFAAEKAAEELAAGKTPSPIELGEEAVIGGIFRGIEPLRNAAKAAILAGTFSTQAFAETFAQTGDIKQAIHNAIAPAVIGGGLGLVGGKKGKKPIPLPGIEEPKRIPTIPESRYEMGTPGYPRPEELPYPVVPYGKGAAPAEMVWNPKTKKYEPGEMFAVEPGVPRPPEVRGLPRPGEEHLSPITPPEPTPDWVKEGREYPPPQYPPVPFEPKAPGFAPGAQIAPPPTVTPSKGVKVPGKPTALATDEQMALVRSEAAKVGGLSTDLIKRWTGLGNKRASYILEQMVDSGEVEGAPPGTPYPWQLKGATPEIAPLPPKLPGDILRYAGEIREIRDIVERGQPGLKKGVETKVYGEEERISYGSSYPNFMKNQGWTKIQVLQAIDKAMRGEELGARQQKIWDSVKKEAKGIFKDRLEEQKKVRLENISTGDLNVGDRVKVKGEVLEVTEKDANKILIKDGQQLELDPFFDTVVGRRLAPKPGVVNEFANVEPPPPNVIPPEKPALSPTAKDQFALPGIKQGLEMKGAKEGVTPTLEGTPLGEAARKAELEKVQPKLPFNIGDRVTGISDQGEFKGTIAEINPDGTVMIGAPDGRMVQLEADKVKLPGRLPAVMADGEILIGSGTHGSIPPERYSEAKDIKVGWVDTEGNFTENKPAAEPIEPTVPETKPPEARTGEIPKEPLNRESVNSFAGDRLRDLKNAPETEIVDTVADIPERLTSQIEENMRNGIKGVYDLMSKKIYLVRETMGNQEDVFKTIDHEAVGHYATEMYLGKEGDPFFDRVYLKYGRSGLKDIADERGFDLNTREGRIDAAKEKIAQLAESGENPGLLKQFYAWIREQMRKLPFFKDLKISDSEIQTTIMKARESLISGEIRAREMKIDSLKRQVRSITIPKLETGAEVNYRGETGWRVNEQGDTPDTWTIYRQDRPGELKSVPVQDLTPAFEPSKPAQFSLGGKAKEVGKAAYEEEIREKGKGLWSGWEWIKKVVSPTTGVKVEDMDMMMKFLADREMATARVEVDTEKGLNEISKLSTREQVDLVNLIQTGTKIDAMPENVRVYAKLHREIEDSVFTKANEILSKSDREAVIAYLDGHVRNFWKVIPRGLEDEIQKRGFQGLSKRPLEGTRAPLHHQYWTLKEGMENGGVPFTTNLLEMTRLNYADTYKLITAHDMWNTLGEIGHRKFIKFGEVMPEGFKPLNDRIANKYFPPKEAGRWVVEENVGRLLENYLSRDLVRENPLLKGLMGIKNVTTAFELGFSLFHLSFITWETIASQIGLGMRKIWNQGMVRQGLKDIIESPITPYKTFKMGKNVERLFRNPDEFIKSTGGESFLKEFPEAKQMIADLFWGGGSVKMNEAYRINSIKTFKENLESKNYIGAALRSIPALSQYMLKPQFEIYIPALKRGVFFKEFANEIAARQADLASGKTTRPELARNIWSFVENRFGEMSFDNLWWNRTFKSGLQLAIRSVTWKLGNIRSYGKAVTGQSSEIISAFKEGRMPKLTQEMAWIWGLGAVTAAMAAITQYMCTGKSPENWKDLVYPQIDKEGGRISLPTYMRDFFHFTHAPTKYVTSSMAGWFGRFTDVLNNKDFYGVQIHDPNENIIMQRVDDLVHMVPLPFSIQSMQRMREQGEAPSRQIMGFVGGTKAPYWIERTTAEQTASDLKAAHLPIGGRSPEDFERGRLVKKYATMYQEASLKRESTDEIMKDLHTDIAKGTLHMADLFRFRQRITREPLIQSVMNLPFRDVLQVWNVASAEERKKLFPVLNRKFYGLRSPEDRTLYFQKMRQIRQEIIGGI